MPPAVFVRPTLPLRLAVNNPFCTAKSLVLVNTPVVPVIAPLTKVSPATVSSNEAMASVPPSIETELPSSMMLSCGNMNVPDNR